MNLKISRYGSYGAIICKGQILLAQKQSGPYKGLWGLPGGKIEFKECPEDALKREILEETAYLAQGFELFFIATYNLRYKQKVAYTDFHHVGMIYIIDKVRPIPNLKAEEKTNWNQLSLLDLNDLTPFAKEAILKQTSRPTLR